MPTLPVIICDGARFCRVPKCASPCVIVKECESPVMDSLLSLSPYCVVSGGPDLPCTGRRHLDSGVWCSRAGGVVWLR